MKEFRTFEDGFIADNRIVPSLENLQGFVRLITKGNTADRISNQNRIQDYYVSAQDVLRDCNYERNLSTTPVYLVDKLF